jgi:hypothetical protein
MSKVIKKAKITKGRTLEVELIERMPDGTDNEHIMKCQQLVHNDLVATFDKLKIHFAKICKLHEGIEIDLQDFNPEQHLKDFKVNSFSIGGNDDSEGVTLSGCREFESGKVLNLNTPFTKYVEDEDYLFSLDLAGDIHSCISEV